jgi:hypothetical protein
LNLRTQWVLALGLPTPVCPFSARDRHIGRVLAEHMYLDGSSCYPSVELVARETNLAASTVRLAISSLEAQGWLHVTRAGFCAGRKHSNTYTPIVPENVRESDVFKDEVRRRRPKRKSPIDAEKMSDSATENIRESDKRPLKAERGSAAPALNGRAALQETCIDCGAEFTTHDEDQARCTDCALVAA